MENIQYNKISECELEIVKPAPIAEPITTKYERSFIEEQIKTITADRDSYVEKRNIEIVECEAILAKMNELKIVTMQIDEVVEKMPSLEEEIITPIIEEQPNL